MNIWKKLQSEITHQNPFWTYRHDVFEIPDGKKGDYYYVSTNGSIMVVPILDKDRLILINNYRYLANRYSLEFPGGAVGKGQTFTQAAVEELRQEAGFEAEELINVGKFNPYNGITDEICQVFLAKGLRQVEVEPDVFEQMEVSIRRPDEVDEMVRKNEIWDGQTLAAWALVHHYFLHKG